MKTSITFLLYLLQRKPTGGVKVVLEYANYLASRGYDVHIVYAQTLDFRRTPIVKKIKSLLRFAYSHLWGYTCRKWFALHDSINEHYVLSLSQRYVPKTYFYVGSSVQTAMCLKDYDIPVKRKLYLIQDFENWRISDSEVYDTYRFGFRNIVISNWLRKKVEYAGASCTLIRNGFDFDYFKLINPIESRSPFTISMLYHNETRKGCEYGIEALKIVHKLYPQLKAILFGIPEPPSDLPEWVEYHQCPDRETHNYIYNASSIFLAPSLQEGWGLPVGEAMICGNAIVCTDTLGFQEMVTDGKEGIIVPVKDSQRLADAMIYLIEHPGKLRDMAHASVATISSFTWDSSFSQFESLLQS